MTGQITPILTISAGVFWIITYSLIIKRGFKDKTFGMPLTALCVNISWEFIYSFIYPPLIDLHRYLCITWFTFDMIILYQVLYYGARDFRNVSPKLFYSGFIFMLVYICYCLIILQSLLGNETATYSAFSDNLMMSALFIAMLLRRNNIGGQSIYIALSKMLGTAFAYLLTSAAELINYLYLGIFILDLSYTILLYRKAKELNLNPWRRI